MRRPYYQEPNFRLRAYLRGIIMVLKIIFAWLAIGLASYSIMWACASEAQCQGRCKSYECTSPFDCGIHCTCIKSGDSWSGVCIEAW